MTDNHFIVSDRVVVFFEYGNGGRVAYTYDEFDRITGISVDGSVNPCYTYEYGANGRAARVTDANLGRTLETEYDLADRPCRSTLKDTNGNIVYRSTLCYDILSNPVQLREDVNGSHVTDFTYDRDNRVTRAQFASNANCRVDNTFDALGRLSNRTATNGAAYATTYSYVGGGYGTNSTTPMVSGITQTGMNFAYAYDSRGNITSETRNGSTTTYAYDGIGQLVRVNDPHENATWVYNYDRGGNITSKVKYAYTTGNLGAAVQTIPYTYDGTWKDKLVSYNGNSITYDAIGNPLSDGTWTYTWEKGRQLKQLSKSGTTIQFKYDHNGIRTQKIATVNGATTTTNYVYNSNRLAHLTQGSNWMHFFYDAQGQPAMVNYNGTLYTYIKSLQGDIVGILNSNGSIVVEYKYDAWGRLLSTTGSMAGTLGLLNPFRYRGYIMDEETGTYYLIGRYYDPNKNRFINADVVLNYMYQRGFNVFCYCLNSPCSLSDIDGESSYTAIHNAVGEDIKSKYAGLDIYLNVRVLGISRTASGYGYIDIVSAATGKIWEVKKLSLSGILAYEQVKDYSNGTAIINGAPVKELSIGGYIPSGEVAVDETTTVHYFYGGHGVIFYIAFDDNSRSDLKLLPSLSPAAKRNMEKNLNPETYGSSPQLAYKPSSSKTVNPLNIGCGILAGFAFAFSTIMGGSKNRFHYSY